MIGRHTPFSDVDFLTRPKPGLPSRWRPVHGPHVSCESISVGVMDFVDNVPRVPI